MIKRIIKYFGWHKYKQETRDNKNCKFCDCKIKKENNKVKNINYQIIDLTNTFYCKNCNIYICYTWGYIMKILYIINNECYLTHYLGYNNRERKCLYYNDNNIDEVYYLSDEESEKINPNNWKDYYDKIKKLQLLQ